MANLLSIRERFDLSFGNDADADRHGIVSRAGGLVPPNHFLSVCADYLFESRGWPARASLGKTVVSSSILDRVARARSRALVEVPVGFKWFVSGLADGSMGFAGEESAGASLLRRDGSLWTTDKDGLVLNLLGAEILARTQRDPAAYYADLEAKLGSSSYTRQDEPASAAQRARIKAIAPGDVRETTLAGDPDHGAPGEGAGQRRRHRGAEGRHGGGVVRHSPIRYRGCVQALRREPPQQGPSRRDCHGGARHRGALDGVGEASVTPRSGGARLAP